MDIQDTPAAVATDLLTQLQGTPTKEQTRTVGIYVYSPANCENAVNFENLQYLDS